MSLNQKYSRLPTTTNDTMVRDWRQALRTPPTYRIGNRTFRFQWPLVIFVAFILVVLLFLIYLRSSTPSESYHSLSKYDSTWFRRGTIYGSPTYNYTYPLTAPIASNGMLSYRIALIADLDKASRVDDKKNLWRSYLKKGYLSYTAATNSLVISFDKEHALEMDSGYALNGRGMELSELVTFNGHILTFDDRTGLVYKIIGEKVVPWVILMDGDGTSTKGFKSEWATVKDEVLFVGSMGKEWTTAGGDFGSYDPMYVKAISVTGEVQHLKWVDNYRAIRKVLGIEWPGYMIHESGMWSSLHRKWYFLPRRCSKERYNETRDEYMGCNALITADEYFRSVQVLKLGTFKPTQGFSSFKFLPGTDDTILVALQTEEINGKTATYISAFTITGTVLLEPMKLDTDFKYEGFEFT